MQNLTGKIKCETYENAINMTLKEGYIGGGPSNRGGVCQVDKDGEGFLVEDIKAEPEKGWQVPEIVKHPAIFRAEREWGQGQKHRVGVEVVKRNAKEF